MLSNKTAIQQQLIIGIKQVDALRVIYEDKKLKKS